MSDYEIEHVLILQGGGSLGAFGCGVFKALANNNIKIDIVAGTSIGAVNAAIIAGSKGDHPQEELEKFWLELADGDARLSSPFVDWFPKYPTPVPTPISQAKSTLSFYRSAFHGNEKVFVPRWNPGHLLSDPQYLTPSKWTYLFDHSPLIKTGKVRQF
jgi:NTE family protein